MVRRRYRELHPELLPSSQGGVEEPPAGAIRNVLIANVIARGAGIEQATTVRDLETFEREMNAALDGNQLKFTVCKVEESIAHREITRTDLDPVENKYQFVRYLERSEGRPIFRGRG